MLTLTGPEPVADLYSSSGAALCCWRFPESTGFREQRPLLVMYHGMNDIARGLLPVAWPLVDHYDVVLADLRGHGASDYTGTYSVAQYYFDSYQLLNHLRSAADDRPLVLFGHSLGGQIAARVAGLFPDQVQALVLAEGLGPPRIGWPEIVADETAEVAALREQILDRFARPAQSRTLPDLAFAAGRLKKNNPRLDPDQARLTAGYGTRRNADNELIWAFDPRVSTVFAGFNQQDSERLWRQVRCPTLTITGALAAEYWRGLYRDESYSGNFQPGEYEARISAFKDVEHQVFGGSGHMVHFDEPGRLSAAIDAFAQAKISTR